MDFFKNGFFKHGFVQSWFFGNGFFFQKCCFQMYFPNSFLKWFLKTAFVKKNFQNIFYCWFLGAKIKNRSAARVLSRPEARKKGCCIFCQSFVWSLVCSAILAQLNYMFCGAIYCIITAQRHEVDDHRGNCIWWPPLASFFCTGTALLVIPGKPEFHGHQSFTERHGRRVGLKFEIHSSSEDIRAQIRFS